MVKKIILGTLLLVASFVTSAASVSITNPSVILGEATVSTLLIPGKLFTFAGDVTPGATSIAWEAELTGAYSATVNLVTSATLNDWTVSILGTGAGSVGNAIGTETTTPFTIYSGTVYTIVVSGIAALDHFSVAFNYPPVLTDIVSEVPVPAAVWLFGSVIAGAFAMRRRAANKAAVAA